jgi:hypothetical protein
MITPVSDPRPSVRRVFHMQRFPGLCPPHMRCVDAASWELQEAIVMAAGLLNLDSTYFSLCYYQAHVAYVRLDLPLAIYVLFTPSLPHPLTLTNPSKLRSNFSHLIGISTV